MGRLLGSNVFGLAELPGTSLVVIGGQSAAFPLDVAATDREPASAEIPSVSSTPLTFAPATLSFSKRELLEAF